MRKCLLLFSLFLALNAHTNVIKDAQAFLTSIGNREGFWLYQSKQYLSGTEQDFLKACQYASGGKTLCGVAVWQNTLFEPLLKIKALEFADNQVLLFLRNGKRSEQSKNIQCFAKRYGLKVIILDKSRANPSFQKAFMRFVSIEQDDVFLLNPKKRQVAIFRSQHPCLLEQDFFNFLWENMPQIEEKK